MKIRRKSLLKNRAEERRSAPQAKGSYVLAVLFLVSIGLTFFYVYKFSLLSFSALKADIAYQHRIDGSADLDKLKFTKYEPVIELKKSYLSWVKADIIQRYERESSVEFSFKDIKLNLSWQAYEILLAVLYFFVWFLLLLKQMGANALMSTIDAAALQAIQGPRLKSIKEKWDFFKAKIDLFCMWKYFSHTVMVVSATLFFVFCVVRQVLFSYRLTADIPIWYRDFLDVSVLLTVVLGAVCCITLSKGISSYSNARRSAMFSVAGVALVIGIGSLATTRLPKLVKFGHISSPRYRAKKHNRVWKMGLSHGLYRHSKSKKFYYVDQQNMLRSHGLVNAMHLEPVPTISQAEFGFVPMLTANSYFERHALYFLEKRKYMDALSVLEMGCRYQLYRMRQFDETAPNIRIFKLYFGLCRKYRLRHHLDGVRNEIIRLQLRSILAPRNERWMLSRAWCFKQRWFSRKMYNHHPIPMHL